LLGLTLDPGRPGRNRLLLYVLPVEGSARRARVTMRVAGQTVSLTECAATCRSGTSMLRSGERVRIVVKGLKGGATTFRVPPLPAPDGTAILAKSLRRMHALRTYRLFEVLSSGLGTVVRTYYSFVAPNRMTISVHEHSVSRSVLIGAASYDLNRPHGRWKVQRGGYPIKVP